MFKIEGDLEQLRVGVEEADGDLKIAHEDAREQARRDSAVDGRRRRGLAHLSMDEWFTDRSRHWTVPQAEDDLETVRYVNTCVTHPTGPWSAKSSLSEVLWYRIMFGIGCEFVSISSNYYRL